MTGMYAIGALAFFITTFFTCMAMPKISRHWQYWLLFWSLEILGTLSFFVAFMLGVRLFLDQPAHGFLLEIIQELEL